MKQPMLENPPSCTPGEPVDAPRASLVWPLLLQLSAKWRAQSRRPCEPVGIGLASDGSLLTTAVDDASAQLIWDESGLSAGSNQPQVVRDFVDLYAPMLGRGRADILAVAHLGQSIDSRIATESGDSYYVTGPGNIVHLHRMRALCDAVLVGAGTVAADNPRLTTRHVEGRNPVRIVMDPERRVSRDADLFKDGEAPSLLVCAVDRLLPGDSEETVIGLQRTATGLALPDLARALRERGLQVLLVEGGGVTVSRWMTAGLLDRLHVSVAPVFIGEGRPAFRLPPCVKMSACPRPRSRVFTLGEDLLWDFDLRSVDVEPKPSDSLTHWPRRVR